MWFDSWSDILRVLLVGAAAYLTLVAVLRVSGKRTLAKLNAFDLVVTVALGSTLATILLTSSVSWSEGTVALVTLVGLQFLVTFYQFIMYYFRCIAKSLGNGKGSITGSMQNTLHVIFSMTE